MSFSGQRTAAMRLGMILGFISMVSLANPASRGKETNAVEAKTRETLSKIREVISANREKLGAEPLYKELDNHIKARTELDNKIRNAEGDKVKTAELERERETLNKELAELGRRRGYELTTRLSGNKELLAGIKSESGSKDSYLKGFANELVGRDRSEKNATDLAASERSAAAHASKMLGIGREEVSAMYDEKNDVSRAMFLDAVNPLVRASEFKTRVGPDGKSVEAELKDEEKSAVKSALLYERQLAATEKRPVSPEALRSVADIVAIPEGGSVSARYEALRGKERQVMTESMGRGEGIVQGLREVISQEAAKANPQLARRAELIKSAPKAQVDALEKLNSEFRRLHDQLMKETDQNNATAQSLREQLATLSVTREELIADIALRLKKAGIPGDTILEFMKQFSDEGRQELATRLLAEMAGRLKEENPKITDEEIYATTKGLACDCAGGPKSLFCKVAQAFPKLVKAGVVAGVGGMLTMSNEAQAAGCSKLDLAKPTSVSPKASSCVNYFVNQVKADPHGNYSTGDKKGH